MNRSEIHDAGAYYTSRYAAGGTLTAAGAGDNTEVDGDWIDRLLSNGKMAMSAKVVIAFTATMQSEETLKFAANLQDATSSAGAGAADYGDALASTTVVTAESGGSTETGVAELDFDLSGAERYVRLQATPNLSAGGTDTAAWRAIMNLHGAGRAPVSASLV